MKLAKLNNTSLNDIREQPDISDLPFPHFIILEPDDSHREQRPENPTSRQIYRLVSLNQLLMLIRIASESIKVLAQSNKRNPRVESCVIQELVWRAEREGSQYWTYKTELAFRLSSKICLLKSQV
ncbi:hypothetical protein TNCT_21461 [Trichonephila clavata]|uniref:Uncharacterized protein n=1 Tax=Trichonephila clavata TaxID=2740835 RepID=A0A8X6G4D4_TRICU|nr:hypothetical protein TNCT_21461 [Trichonephila clavata]